MVFGCKVGKAIEGVLEDICCGEGVLFLLFGAEGGFCFAEGSADGGAGEALVPEGAWEFRGLMEVSREVFCGLGARAYFSVHQEGDSDDEACRVMVFGEAADYFQRFREADMSYLDERGCGFSARIGEGDSDIFRARVYSDDSGVGREIHQRREIADFCKHG